MNTYVKPYKGKQTIVKSGKDGMVQVNTYNGDTWRCVDVKANDQKAIDNELEKGLIWANK